MNETKSFRGSSSGRIFMMTLILEKWQGVLLISWFEQYPTAYHPYQIAFKSCSCLYLQKFCNDEIRHFIKTVQKLLLRFEPKIWKSNKSSQDYITFLKRKHLFIFSNKVLNNTCETTNSLQSWETPCFRFSKGASFSPWCIIPIVPETTLIALLQNAPGRVVSNSIPRVSKITCDHRDWKRWFHFVPERAGFSCDLRRFYLFQELETDSGITSGVEKQIFVRLRSESTRMIMWVDLWEVRSIFALLKFLLQLSLIKNKAAVKKWQRSNIPPDKLQCHLSLQESTL